MESLFELRVFPPGNFAGASASEVTGAPHESPVRNWALESVMRLEKQGIPIRNKEAGRLAL